MLNAIPVMLADTCCRRSRRQGPFIPTVIPRARNPDHNVSDLRKLPLCWRILFVTVIVVSSLAGEFVNESKVFADATLNKECLMI